MDADILTAAVHWLTVFIDFISFVYERTLTVHQFSVVLGLGSFQAEHSGYCILQSFSVIPSMDIRLKLTRELFLKFC